MKTKNHPDASGRQAYIDTLTRCGLLADVPERRRAEAAAELHIQVQTFSREELIVLEGQTVKDIAVLHSGTVRGEKFHEEGEVDLLYMYRKGETFGAEGAASRFRSSPLTYIANEDSVVLRIPINRVWESTFAEAITAALLRILADDNIKKLYKIEVLSKRGLRERIMTHLRLMSRKADSRTFSIHMDRLQFAQYLCVNRSALSYELNEMKRDGLIRFKKDQFELLEKAVPQHKADF